MVTRTFPGSYDSLEQLSLFVVEQASAAGLSDPEVYGVQLAVDEAATNIIEHGYGDENQGEITCQCEILPDGLRVVLQDHAQPFEPQTVPSPILKTPLDEIAPRGLGLFFIHKMMDEVSFGFDPQTGNTLTMVKHRKNTEE